MSTGSWCPLIVQSLSLPDSLSWRSFLSVFMSPPPLSWWRLLVLVLVVMMGMLGLAGAVGGADVRSSSESLLLELSLLEDDELLESEELSPLLS